MLEKGKGTLGGNSDDCCCCTLIPPKGIAVVGTDEFITGYRGTVMLFGIPPTGADATTSADIVAAMAAWGVTDTAAAGGLAPDIREGGPEEDVCSAVSGDLRWFVDTEFIS